MNEQFYTPEIVERSDQNTNTPAVNWDAFTSKVSVDAVIIEETLVGEETAAVVDPPDWRDHSPEAIAHEAPMAETKPYEAPIGTNAGSSTALINHEESEHFRMRWNEIQGMFVDEPRFAVQQADALVSEVIKHITQMFANEHSLLDGQWNQGNDVSTEDLRKALQRYRTFFNRLVV